MQKFALQPTILCLLVTLLTPISTQADITLRGGRIIPGTLIDTGTLGLAIKVLPRGEFAVTRCKYEGGVGGIKATFVDGGWIAINTAMEIEDLAYCLKHCLEFNATKLGLKQVPIGNNDDITKHYKSTLSAYIADPAINRAYRRAQTNTLWFYMRHAHLEDQAGTPHHYPLVYVDKFTNGLGLNVNAAYEFSRHKKNEINQQQWIMRQNMQEIKIDTEVAIHMLPTTAFGPDFSLRYAGGSARAIAQLRLQNVQRLMRDNYWRNRYLAILTYAR